MPHELLNKYEIITTLTIIMITITALLQLFNDVKSVFNKK